MLPANGRTWNAIAGSGAMILARLVTSVASYLLVAILARYLSRSDFGLYAILTSYMTLTGGLDFGVGNGLRNKLAALGGWETEDTQARQYFLSALYVFSLLVGLIIVGLALFSPVLPWDSMLNISDSRLIAEGAWSLPVIISLVLVSVPLSLADGGFFAYQKSYWKAILDLLPNLLSLLFVIVATVFRLSLYPVMIAYFTGIVLAALLKMGAFLRLRQWLLTWISPAMLWSHVRELAGSSVWFWLLSMLAAVTVNTSTLAASQVLGLETAGDFNVVQRLFFFLLTFHIAAVTPFWSAFTHAQALGDWRWAKSALNRMVLVSVGSVAVASSLLLLLYQPLIFWWTGKQINDAGFVVMMAIWTVAYAWTSSYSICLSGFSLVRPQVILGFLSALLIFPLTFFFGHAWGAMGVMVAYVLVILPGAVANPVLCYIYIERKMQA